MALLQSCWRELKAGLQLFSSTLVSVTPRSALRSFRSLLSPSPSRHGAECICSLNVQGQVALWLQRV